jgi:hypothetical protein
LPPSPLCWVAAVGGCLGGEIEAVENGDEVYGVSFGRWGKADPSFR